MSILVTLKSLSIEHPIPKEVLMTTIWLKDMVQDGGAAANKSHGEAKKCKDYASNKSLLHIITLSINDSLVLTAPYGIWILAKRHGNRQTQRKFPVIAKHFVHSDIDGGCSRKRPIFWSIAEEHPSFQDVKDIKCPCGKLNLVGILSSSTWDIHTVVPICCQCRKATSGSGHTGHYPVLRLEKELGKMDRYGRIWTGPTHDKQSFNHCPLCSRDPQKITSSKTTTGWWLGTQRLFHHLLHLNCEAGGKSRWMGQDQDPGHGGVLWLWLGSDGSLAR